MEKEEYVIDVVGGVYLERCMQPSWLEVYGSGGRAASALARMGAEVRLHSYISEANKEAIESRAALEGFLLNATQINKGCSFHYTHGLDNPTINLPLDDYADIQINAERVVKFGLIEGDAVVKATFAVYDPQNVTDPASFRANGSTATHLALVLNRYEAAVMCKRMDLDISEIAALLASQEQAEIVVIKMGPSGALIYDKGEIGLVPAFSTNHVWKIGSGDTFVAHFAYQWMQQGLAAIEAARLASKATAFYCENAGFPSKASLERFDPPPIVPSSRFKNGYSPMVYIAGPFFTLNQLWLVEQIMNNLRDMGLQIFSPYHDVGHGSADDVVQKDLEAIDKCDLMFAIGDAMDPGTIYEIGYARAKGKPVIMYCENESSGDKKMMEGSGCILCSDYVTAIYKTLWTAISL
ncbi:PfkB family carbohydrate kinase [Undibacterium sp. Ji83W]|uniref:PfkB family carbohydrate kinase n=1 Tax=Undibacterium sp. Ji83W TaxID=3413043 RepID=UPI003BF43120